MYFTLFSESTDPPQTDEPASTTTTPSEDSSGGTLWTWLLPLLIVLGVLLLLLPISFIIYRKFNCFGLLPRKTFQLATPIVRRLSSKGSIASSSIFSMISNTSLSKSSSIRKYKKYLVTRSEDLSLRNLWREWESLKRESPQNVPVTIALKPENLLRNRFSNVLPYDRNRVILKPQILASDDESSSEESGLPAAENDYVNASYLSGLGGDEQFISTQGPLSNTVDDFWRMCWDAKASSIVMLTKCYENGKEKCYPYWPTDNLSPSLHSLPSGITIRLQNVSGYQFHQHPTEDKHSWLISELSMERGQETRQILHFFYLSWPDFGVVSPPVGLLCFLGHFRKVLQENVNSPASPEGNPELIIVHCSAGVGRTGVFIAVDNLFQKLSSSPRNSQPPSPNIFQIVQKMRTERMGMVQTPEQYKLIYDCLQELWNLDKENTSNASSSPNPSSFSLPQPTKVFPDLIRLAEWGTDPTFHAF